MASNLGRKYDPGLGQIGIGPEELPPLPDSILTDPEAGRFDPRAWFRRPERPFEIEVGCGKGAFLAQQAALDPATNYLGIEKEGEFWAFTADRCRRAGLENVRVLHADAVEFFRWRCPGGIARVVHLYFSDPWPKSRHHKHRVLSDRFLGEAARILAPGGEVRIVTDHDDYWAWMEEHFARWCGGGRAFERAPFTAPASARTGELVGSNFERKYRREGRPFHAAVLRRV